MLKFLKIFLPAGAGAASLLSLAYIAADQFVVDIPAPIREAIELNAAQAQEAKEAKAAAAAELAARNAELAVAGLAPSIAGGYGLGREALVEEIAAWNDDVRPDGQGLPVGSGDVWTGEEVFVEKCAACHGDFGEAVGRWPVLAGGFGTLSRKDPVKTIGSYWPYLSTVFDYVNRAMPFGEANSLPPDEVYSITAYLLYVNDLADEDFTLSNENFTEVRLPNEENFKDDDRLEVEFPQFVRPDICMENCKETVEITMHASVLDVTPEETAARAAAEAAEAAAEAASDAAVIETADVGIDPALVAEGENLFKKCRSCHQIGEGAVDRTGPQLNGIVGRAIGSIDGFNYSGTLADAGASGGVWNEETLGAFLANPKAAMPGTKMSFAGFKSEEDIAAMIAYLQSAGGQ